jgi:fatty-acid desaturase
MYVHVTWLKQTNERTNKQTNKHEPSLNQGSSRDGDHKYNLQSSLVCQNLVCLPLPTRSMQHQWQLMISCFLLTPCLGSRHLFANSCYISCLSCAIDVFFVKNLLLCWRWAKLAWVGVGGVVMLTSKNKWLVNSIGVLTGQGAQGHRAASQNTSVWQGVVVLCLADLHVLAFFDGPKFLALVWQ